MSNPTATGTNVKPSTDKPTTDAKPAKTAKATPSVQEILAQLQAQGINDLASLPAEALAKLAPTIAKAAKSKQEALDAEHGSILFTRIGETIATVASERGIDLSKLLPLRTLAEMVDGKVAVSRTKGKGSSGGTGNGTRAASFIIANEIESISCDGADMEKTSLEAVCNAMGVETKGASATVVARKNVSKMGERFVAHMTGGRSVNLAKLLVSATS